MFKVLTRSSVTLCVAVLCVACTNNHEMESEGMMGTDKFPTKVVCDENTVICWKELDCGFDPNDDINDAAEVCSAVFHEGNLSHRSDYPNAVFDGVCNESEDDADGEPPGSTLPCRCIRDGDVPLWGPADWDPNGFAEPACYEGDMEEEGVPTTGEGEPEGYDTDGPGEELYICSITSQQNCQTRTGEGIHATDHGCWVSPGLVGDHSECVIATNLEDAQDACGCSCENAEAAYVDICHTPDICEITTHLDCGFTDTFVDTAPEAAGFLCSIIHNLPVICPTTIRLFDATVAVALAGGTTTSVTGLVGYLDFSISNCNISGQCEFEMPLLAMSNVDVAGTYLQGTSLGSYEIDDLFLQMDGSLSGVYHIAQGNITFPTDTITVSGGMASGFIDSIALPMIPPGERLTMSTDQIVGSSAFTTSSIPNPVTLNLTFNVPGGTVWVSLTSR